jgi:hypothetical protein
MNSFSFRGGRCDVRGKFHAHADFKTSGYERSSGEGPGFLNVRIVNDRDMNLEARVAEGANGTAQLVALTFHGKDEMKAAIAIFKFLASDIEQVLGECHE